MVRGIVGGFPLTRFIDAGVGADRGLDGAGGLDLDEDVVASELGGEVVVDLFSGSDDGFGSVVGSFDGHDGFVTVAGKTVIGGVNLSCEDRVTVLGVR